MDKLLSDSKFKVLPTHSKSICFTNYEPGTDLWRGYLKEKKDEFSFGCLDLEMPTAYHSGDAQQADGPEALGRVLT